MKSKSTSPIVSFTCGTLLLKKTPKEIVTLAADMAYENAIADVVLWLRSFRDQRNSLRIPAQVMADDIEQLFGDESAITSAHLQKEENK